MSIKLNSRQSRAPIGTLQATPDTGAEASIIGIQEIRSLEQKKKRRARQTVYWPGINIDIQNVVEACNACQKNLPSLQQEPLMSDPPPSRPFEDVSADLFCYAGKSYMNGSK